MTMKPTTDEPVAGDVMARTFLTVAPEDTIGEVAEAMVEANAGSALVVDFGRLVGILTSRDVLRAIADRVHPSEARVREWMTAEPVTAARETPADDAARLMLAGGFHHLPVVDGEQPVGIVGLRAVIGAVRAGWPGW
jgi:CBS domain-containing protein